MNNFQSNKMYKLRKKSFIKIESHICRIRYFIILKIFYFSNNNNLYTISSARVCVRAHE